MEKFSVENLTTEEFVYHVANFFNYIEEELSASVIPKKTDPGASRAIAYWLIRNDESAIKQCWHPFQFACLIQSVFKALNGGEHGLRSANNRSFYFAYFGTENHSWPIGCGHLHTLAITGDLSDFKEIKFSPNEEEYRMAGTGGQLPIVQTQHTRTTEVQILSYSSIAEQPQVPEAKQVMLETEATSEMQIYLPSGNFCKAIVTDKSGSERIWDVEFTVDGYSKGLGGERWKSAREKSCGQIFMNFVEAQIEEKLEIKEHEEKDSPIDVSIYNPIRGNFKQLDCQITTIEDRRFYQALVLKTSTKFQVKSTDIESSFVIAVQRKEKMASNALVLLIDIGFFIPLSSLFIELAQGYYKDVHSNYRSVWLCSRFGVAPIHIYGMARPWE